MSDLIDLSCWSYRESNWPHRTGYEQITGL